MKRIRPARAIGLAVRYSERLVAKQLGNKTFGTARHITTTLKGLQAYGRFSTPDPGSGDQCAAQNLHKIQVGAKNSQALVFSVGLFISQPSALRTSFFSLTSQKSSHRGTLRHL